MVAFCVFYLCYPQIAELFTEKANLSFVGEKKSVVSDIQKGLKQIGQMPSAQFKNGDSSIVQMSSDQFRNGDSSNVQTQSAQFQDAESETFVPPIRLITNLSFSHFVELIRLEEPLKRTFYEIESIKGNWAVKELQRQVNTLLFERTGLSKNKSELIRLKTNEADYTAITQLNTYVSYYRKNIMQNGDMPTIGILLCTNKDEAFVEYALAGLDEKIFIRQYLLYIPAKEKLEQFIKQEIQNR